MKKYRCSLIVIAGLIYACGSNKSAPSSPAAPSVKVEMTAALAEGKSLYEGSCARCHQLYKPSDFNAQAWKPIVARMQKKAQLSDEQGMKIYNYLTSGVE